MRRLFLALVCAAALQTAHGYAAPNKKSAKWKPKNLVSCLVKSGVPLTDQVPLPAKTAEKTHVALYGWGERDIVLMLTTDDKTRLVSGVLVAVRNGSKLKERGIEFFLRAAECLSGVDYVAVGSALERADLAPAGEAFVGKKNRRRSQVFVVAESAEWTTKALSAANE